MIASEIMGGLKDLYSLLKNSQSRLEEVLAEEKRRIKFYDVKRDTLNYTTPYAEAIDKFLNVIRSSSENDIAFNVVNDQICVYFKFFDRNEHEEVVKRLLLPAMFFDDFSTYLENLRIEVGESNNVQEKLKEEFLINLNKSREAREREEWLRLKAIYGEK